MQSVTIHLKNLGVSVRDADLAHNPQDLKEILSCACGQTSTIFELLERMKNEKRMTFDCPACKRQLVRLSVVIYTKGFFGSL